MQVVAGPSGSGKSSLLPVAAAGIDHFNIDDRCAQLSQGTYVGIKPEIRARANAECEAFIARHIESKTSFAVETTLRTDITFRQGASARANGFVLLMEYISAGSPDECVRRVTIRADRGGHSAPPSRVRATYAGSCWPPRPCWSCAPLGKPFLTSLASRAVVFDQAYSTSGWTSPATASLFTSLYPLQHGVIAGIQRQREEPFRFHRLPQGVETMAQALKRAGYATYAISDNIHVSPLTGFDPGFDAFESASDASAVAVNRRASSRSTSCAA